MLVKYNGDERKAYAAFNAGTEVVDKAITTAAKSGEPAMWATKLPEQFGKLLENSKVVVSDKDNALATYIPSLRAKQEQIKTANPQSYNEIFDEGSSVALAQDIQKDLASQGINFTWNAIHQYMEQNNLMPNQAASENQKSEVENVYMKAWETKNNPELFKKLSKQEQEELNLILDPPLESSYPEDFLLGAVGLAKILGLKLGTKVAGKSFNKVFSEDRAITAKPLSKSKIDELNKTDAQRRKVLQEESKPVRNTKGSQTSALEKTKANLNGEDVAIKQKYATLYTKDKKSLENGTITQEEFRNRASDYNRKLKEELAAKGLK